MGPRVMAASSSFSSWKGQRVHLQRKLPGFTRRFSNPIRTSSSTSVPRATTCRVSLCLSFFLWHFLSPSLVLLPCHPFSSRISEGLERTRAAQQTENTDPSENAPKVGEVEKRRRDAGWGEGSRRVRSGIKCKKRAIVREHLTVG